MGRYETKRAREKEREKRSVRRRKSERKMGCDRKCEEVLVQYGSVRNNFLHLPFLVNLFYGLVSLSSLLGTGRTLY